MTKEDVKLCSSQIAEAVEKWGRLVRGEIKSYGFVVPGYDVELSLLNEDIVMGKAIIIKVNGILTYSEPKPEEYSTGLIENRLKAAIGRYTKLQGYKYEKLSKDSERQAELDQGLRYNGGKNRLDLIPCSLIDGVGRVLTFGAQKYAPDNWRKFNQQQVKECIGSAMRHIEQYRQGNWLDPESGLPHLAHAATNLGFILELHKED